MKHGVIILASLFLLLSCATQSNTGDSVTDSATPLEQRLMGTWIHSISGDDGEDRYFVLEFSHDEDGSLIAEFLQSAGFGYRPILEKYSLDGDLIDLQFRMVVASDVTDVSNQRVTYHLEERDGVLEGVFVRSWLGEMPVRLEPEPFFAQEPESPSWQDTIAEIRAEHPRPPFNPQDDDTVEFASAGLEAQVRKAVGKPSGELTYADVKNLEELSFAFVQVPSLDGIEYLTNLRRLNLDITDVADIDSLCYLEGLESLSIEKGGIKDLWPLAYLENLRDLQLLQHEITDLRPILASRSLRTLRVDRNRKLVDISPIFDLPQLTKLGIGDISPGARPTALPNRERLTSLNLAKLSIRYLYDDLAAMPALKELVLNETDVENLDFLASMPGLETLELFSDSLLRDFSGLSHSTQLKELWIQSTGIRDLSPLAGLTHLERLQARMNRITDLSPLRDLVSLKQLYLGYNAISDIEPLTGLENLELLQLHHNRITELPSMTGLTSLKTIYLEDNPLGDARALLSVPSLEYVNIDEAHHAVLREHPNGELTIK